MRYEIPMFYDFSALSAACFWVCSLILGKNPVFCLYFMLFLGEFFKNLKSDTYEKILFKDCSPPDAAVVRTGFRSRHTGRL